MMAAVCCTSCNNEWEDEQFKQLASFKAEINNEGVTSTYVRYKPGGVVTYQLPVLLSGSTMNTQARTIHVALDKDTLDVLNQERFGERRRELFYHLLDQQYYSIPETVEMPAGESEALLSRWAKNSLMTGLLVKAERVMGVINSFPAGVITTCTSAPCFISPRMI